MWELYSTPPPYAYSGLQHKANRQQKALRKYFFLITFSSCQPVDKKYITLKRVFDHVRYLRRRRMMVRSLHAPIRSSQQLYKGIAGGKGFDKVFIRLIQIGCKVFPTQGNLMMLCVCEGKGIEKRAVLVAWCSDCFDECTDQNIVHCINGP